MRQISLLIAASAFLVPVAYAETSPDVGEVTVTAKKIDDSGAIAATRLDVKSLDVPQAIQSVPIDLIEDEGFLRLGDAVRNVSGVVRKEAYLGLSDSFGIRGFDSRLGLWNGFRRDFYQSALDLSHVERIDVLKGPSSISSGFLEPGGVVDVVTKRATPAPVAEFDVMGGSFGRARAQWDVGDALNPTLSGRLTGAIDRADSFRDFVYSNRQTIGGTLAWRPNDGTTVEFFSYWTNTHSVPERGFPAYVLGAFALGLPLNRFLGDPGDRDHTRVGQFAVLADQKITGDWSVRVGASYDETREDNGLYQPSTLEADDQTLERRLTNETRDTRQLSAFAELHGAFNTGAFSHKFVAGFEHTDFRQGLDGLNGDTDPINIFNPNYGSVSRSATDPAFDFHEKTPTNGVFIQDLIETKERWELLLSGRYDRVNDLSVDTVAQSYARTDNSAFTPRVGLLYKVSPTFVLYTNYAKSFDPNIGILLANGAVPAPSRGRQVEFGAKYSSLDELTEASIAAYQIIKTNVAAQDPNDPTFTYSVLTGEDRSRGIELDWSLHPVSGLRLNTSAAYNKAIVVRDTTIPDGNTLLNAPRWLATLTSRYDIPGTSLGVGVNIFYVGAREADLPNDFQIPSYTRLDLAAFYRLGQHVEFALNVQNVSGIRYFDGQDYSIFPGAPRNFLLTMKVKR